MQSKELKIKLENMNKGANVHTINKALFYWEGWKTQEMAQSFYEMVEKAYNSGDWKEVKLKLSRLW